MTRSWPRGVGFARPVACILLVMGTGCIVDRGEFLGRGRDAGVGDGPAPDGDGPAMHADGSAAADGQGSCDWPYGASNIDPCDPTLSIRSKILINASSNLTVDTDECEASLGGSLRSQSSTPSAELCVLAVPHLEVQSGATMLVAGTRALVILVHGDAVVDGLIDVSAPPDRSAAGPGGEPDDCHGVGGSVTTNTNQGGGGGTGGAFGTDSGGGGAGVGTTATPAMAPAGNATVVPLRGGCAGGDGAEGSEYLSQGGTAGRGGGGLQVTVRGTLMVFGTVSAAGSGGAGGLGTQFALTGGGGGGGGSGGAILLEATDVILGGSARLCANGGAGGEGSSYYVNGGHGGAGECGSVAAVCPDNTPWGGNGGTGYAFGSGSATSGSAGTTGSNPVTPGGGGGGGGGAGRIRINSLGPVAATTALSSPPFTSSQ